MIFFFVPFTPSPFSSEDTDYFSVFLATTQDCNITMISIRNKPFDHLNEIHLNNEQNKT